MSKKIFPSFTVLFLLPLFILPSLSQKLVCKPKSLTAVKPFPKLKYKCNENLTDSEDAVLTQPNRLKALKSYAKSLEKFTAADWWTNSVEDLNVCEFRKKPGVLTKAETEKFKQEYFPTLSGFPALTGNNQFRMITAPDPCYQTGYNGADLFLLYRKNGRVFATEIYDGYYSRADFGPGIDFATLNGQQIFEIWTTTGGLYPMVINYYFVLDKKTNQTKPLNLFKDEGKMTNVISSMMLLSEPEDYGLPPKSEPLVIINKGRLTKSFNVFVDKAETSADGDRQSFTIKKFRWNGKFFE